VEVFSPHAAPLIGRHLIEASAGTGKTFAIATLYLRVLVERGLRVGEILVVTYTRAATAELRVRLRERLRQALDVLERHAPPPDADLRDLLTEWRERGWEARARTAIEGALGAFDEAAIHTMHAFCQRMLRELAFESGAAFDAELAGDEVLLRDEIVRDYWVRAMHGAPDALIAYLQKPSGADALAALAARVGGDPTLPVLPEWVDIEPGALDDALAVRRTAWLAAQEIWRREGETVKALLCGPHDLKKNSYAVERIRNVWLPALDAHFAHEGNATFDRGAGTRKHVAALSTSHLEAGTRKNGHTPQHPFFDACEDLAASDGALLQTLEAHAVRLNVEFVSYLRSERRRRRDASNTRSFDDLLQILCTALGGDGGDELADRIRKRFPFAMIDECQDTDPQQHAIFSRLYGDGRDSALYQIGDPKQAIFAFRGADVFSYLDAKEQCTDGPRTLLVNWRSDPGLLRAVQTLFERARLPFLLEEIGIHPVEPQPEASDALGGSASLVPLQVLLLPAAKGESISDVTPRVVRATATEIAATLASDLTIKGKQVVARDIAVLCRTNQQAIAVQDALRELGVPSVLHGDKSVFDTQEGEELQRLLAALANPSDTAAIRAALVTTLLGVDGTELHRLLGAEREWDDWAERFEAWHQLWVGFGFMRAFRRALADREIVPRLLRLHGGERRITNVLHLAELLHGAEGEERRGPQQLVRWLELMRADPSARGDYAGDAEQVRLESDANAVTVVTIHKSKGLEYAIAYCPFLWPHADLRNDDKLFARFHDPDDGRRLKLDIGSPEHDAHVDLAAKESLAESLRLTYVALTRARHRCTLVWGLFKKAKKSPLAYLLHQPEHAGGDHSEGAAARFEALDEAAFRRDLESLEAAAQGTIEVRDLLSSAAAASARPPDGADVPLEARRRTRTLTRHWRVSSFTALTALDRGDERQREEGLDHDADETELSPVPAPAPTPTVALADFPAGAAAGRLLHGIMERLDFCAADAGVLHGATEGSLVAHGFASSASTNVAAALAAALETPLDAADPSLTLRHVPRDRRLDEMEFVLPVAPGLSAGRLGGVLARHGAPARLPDYAGRLRMLEFEALAGYLRGFIDLVFEHAGRWYVVDYKSNHLGAAAADYAPARLDQAMARHHYVLQYLLYTVAVHRHLAARLPGYDYARHFGGVRYLFLRGMSPAHPPGCGVYQDLPPPALIRELSELFGEPRP
jgi:exodeoxyribonuclease V beta subunit